MTEKEWQRIVREFAIYPLSVCEASFICSDKMREIRKNGGSRQRSEGVKLLQRIKKRLVAVMNESGERAKSTTLRGLAQTSPDGEAENCK